MHLQRKEADEKRASGVDVQFTEKDCEERVNRLYLNCFHLHAYNSEVNPFTKL